MENPDKPLSQLLRSLTREEYAEAYAQRMRRMAIEGGCETEAEIQWWLEHHFGRGQDWTRRPTPYRYYREARRTAAEDRKG